jgi:predicted MFS family arabinose efflux permease
VRGIGRFGFDAASVYVMGVVQPGVVLCAGIAVAAVGVLVCGLFPDAIAGTAIGTLGVFIAVGPAVGILVGGVISDYAGYRSLFLTCAGLIWIPFFLLYPWRQRTYGRERGEERERLPWSVVREVMSVPGVPLLCACSVYIFFYQQALSLALAFYATDSLGLSLSVYGILRSLIQGGNMSGRYLGGRSSDRFGSSASLLSGFLISGLGFLLLPLSRSFWPLLVMGSIIYVGTGLINVSSQVGIMSMVRSRYRAHVIGLYRAVGDIGLFLGPLVVTSSLQNLGFLWSFMWLGTLPFLFAFLVFSTYPKK